MAYVVVVLAMINVLALGGMGWVLWRLRWDTMMHIQTVVQDEMKKLDDRIEKRNERVQRQAEDPAPTAPDGRIQVGVPYRR